MTKKPLRRLEIPIIPYDKVPANVNPLDAAIFFSDFCDEKITATHEYRNKSGELLCYSVSIQNKQHNHIKMVLPVRWCHNRNFSINHWEIKGFNDNEKPPIYGAEKLSKNDKTVLIVENEEKADKVSKIFPKYNVVSWLGGVRTVDKVDWSQLKGKEAVICTSNSKDGIKARKEISKELYQHNIENSYVKDIKNLHSDPQQHKKGLSLVSKLLGGIKKNSAKLFSSKKQQQNINSSEITEEVKEKSSPQEKPSIKINETDITKVFNKGILDNNKFVGIHEYKDTNGKLLGYGVRFEDKTPAANGKPVEKILPVSWGVQETKYLEGWVLKPPTNDGSTPIYGAEKLSNNNKTVLLVGNEKAADNASKLFPEYAVISWFGGEKTAEKVDWTQLKGKNVIIWPDNDERGVKLGYEISQTLKRFSATKVYLMEVHRLWLDPKKDVGWNLSDPLPDGLKLRDIELFLGKGERETNMPITKFKENKDTGNIHSPAKTNTNSDLSSNINPASIKTKTHNSSKDTPSQQQKNNDDRGQR